MVPAHMLRPNPWNPNRMTADMMKKERASIREFGFIDPITARIDGGSDEGWYQIIDGEHRWVAGKAEGIEEFPVIVLDVDEDEAKELTIILNETRGESEPDLLSGLLRDLAERRERIRMESLLPFDKGRLDQFLERREIDWEELDKRREDLSKRQGKTDQWVEKVYRMPAAAASVIDEAIERVREEEGVDQDWRALEMISADFLGS